MKKKSCIILLIMGWALAAYAQENGRIRVTGAGFAPGGDMAAARDNAFIDAKIRAVESVCGTRVDAGTLIQKALLIDDALAIRAKGHVKIFEVLKENYDQALQLFYVTISANVDCHAINRDVTGITGQKKLLFLRSEDSKHDSCLVQKLGYLFDSDGFALSQDFVSTDDLDIMDRQKAARILSSRGKDILICCRVDAAKAQCMTANYCAARAGGFIRLYSPFNPLTQDAGVVEERQDGIKGFGNTASMAESKAVQKLSDELVDGFMSRLEKTVDKTLKIQVMDMPDYNEYQLFKNRLMAFRWVTAVNADGVGFHPAKSVFIVEFRGGRERLGKMLEALNHYEYLGRQTDVYS